MEVIHQLRKHDGWHVPAFCGEISSGANENVCVEMVKTSTQEIRTLLFIDRKHTVHPLTHTLGYTGTAKDKFFLTS